jgi:hypothetical protein
MFDDFACDIITVNNNKVGLFMNYQITYCIFNFAFQFRLRDFLF